MRGPICLIIAVALLASPVYLARAEEPAVAAGEVVRVRIDDQAITPVTARFIDRALREAEDAGAACLVIELDTPGGLLQSTRHIVRSILGANVPVVVYVAPSGARAASAGLFITLAAHVAAMSPGTNIGAAHPVTLNGIPAPDPDRGRKGDEKDEAEANEKENEQEAAPAQRRRPAAEEKIVADTAAWARSLANLRGRNAEWAVLAVTESRSITSSEAAEQNVVDLLADNLRDLLTQLDGRTVAIAGQEIQLETAGAAVRTVDMWWGEQVLGVLSNPNVAFLLLVLGFYGIVFELYSPGWGVAGILGTLSLLLGFFALSILPVNYVGLALIALAMGLFVAEAVVTSYGALAVAGVVCMTLGGLMLIDSPAGFMRVSWAVLVPVAIATGIVVVFLVANIIKSQSSPKQTGREGLVGRTAETRGPFVERDGHYRGQVLIHGELWQAESAEPLSERETVVVQAMEGLLLHVIRRHAAEAPSAGAEPEARRENTPSSQRRNQS